MYNGHEIFKIWANYCSAEEETSVIPPVLIIKFAELSSGAAGAGQCLIKWTNSLLCHITSAPRVGVGHRAELGCFMGQELLHQPRLQPLDKPISLPLSEDPPGPALEMSTWGTRHCSDAKESQQPAWKGSKSVNLRLQFPLYLYIYKYICIYVYMYLFISIRIYKPSLLLWFLFLIYLNCLEGKSTSKRFSCSSSQTWGSKWFIKSNNKQNIFGKFWLFLCFRIWVKMLPKHNTIWFIFFGWNYWEF